MDINIEIKKEDLKKKLNIKDGVDGKDGVGKPGKNGKDGKDGKTPTKKELKELIKPLIPEPKNGVDGEDGSPDTGEEIINKINDVSLDAFAPRIDASHIKNLPSLMSGMVETFTKKTVAGAVEDNATAGTLTYDANDLIDTIALTKSAGTDNITVNKDVDGLITNIVSIYDGNTETFTPTYDADDLIISFIVT